MRTYTTKRPRLAYEWWEEDRPFSEGRTVYEPEGNHQPTGLLDKHGNELFAVNSIGPIGFVTKTR